MKRPATSSKTDDATRLAKRMARQVLPTTAIGGTRVIPDRRQKLLRRLVQREWRDRRPED